MKKFTLQRMRRQRHHTIESEPEEHVKDAIIHVLADNNNVPKMTVARVPIIYRASLLLKDEVKRIHGKSIGHSNAIEDAIKFLSNEGIVKIREGTSLKKPQFLFGSRFIKLVYGGNNNNNNDT